MFHFWLAICQESAANTKVKKKRSTRLRLFRRRRKGAASQCGDHTKAQKTEDLVEASRQLLQRNQQRLLITSLEAKAPRAMERARKQGQRRGISNASPFFRGNCKKGDNCNYEHQVDGKPIPIGPEFIQRLMRHSSDSVTTRLRARLRLFPSEGLESLLP